VEPLAFYSVAATVIPVLLIALVFQAKLTDPKPQHPIVALILGVLLAVSIVSEVATLKALSTGQPTHAEHLFAVIGLFVAGFALTYVPIVTLVGEEGEIRSRTQNGAWLAITVLVWVPAIVAAFAF
jgi:hypothetical protein